MMFNNQQPPPHNQTVGLGGALRVLSPPSSVPLPNSETQYRNYFKHPAAPRDNGVVTASPHIVGSGRAVADPVFATFMGDTNVRRIQEVLQKYSDPPVHIDNDTLLHFMTQEWRADPAFGQQYTGAGGWLMQATHNNSGEYAAQKVRTLNNKTVHAVRQHTDFYAHVQREYVSRLGMPGKGALLIGVPQRGNPYLKPKQGTVRHLPLV